MDSGMSPSTARATDSQMRDETRGLVRVIMMMPLILKRLKSGLHVEFIRMADGPATVSPSLLRLLTCAITARRRRPSLQCSDTSGSLQRRSTRAFPPFARWMCTGRRIHIRKCSKMSGPDRIDSIPAQPPPKWLGVFILETMKAPTGSSGELQSGLLSRRRTMQGCRPQDRAWPQRTDCSDCMLNSDLGWA